MKRKFLGLAVIAASMMAFSAMAQMPQSQPDQAPDREMPQQEDMRPDRGCPQAERPCPKANPFESLNLSDDQKSKLQQLRQDRDAKRREQDKAFMEQKHREDSLKMVDMRNERKEYLNQIKSIIGSDKYVTLLENLVLDNECSPAPSDKCGMRDGRMFDKPGKPGKRGPHDKANKPNKSKKDKTTDKAEKADK
jgi:Spy/CpxP family protein refolding chaperone